MFDSQITNRRIALGVVRNFDIAYLEENLNACAKTGSVDITMHKHVVDSRHQFVNVDVQSTDSGSVADFCEFLLLNINKGGTDGTNVSTWASRYIARVVRFCEWMNERNRWFDLRTAASY